MAKKMTKRKKERQKQERVDFWIRFLLSFFAVIVPLIALTLGVLGVDYPGIVLVMYTSVASVVVGVFIVVFAALEKFGFGKPREYFIRADRHYLTKKEAKISTVIFGCMVIVFGLALALLTVIYR